MIIPEASRMMITAKHHDEVVESYRQRLAQAEERAKRSAAAHLKDMALMASMVRLLRKHDIPLPKEMQT